MAELFVENIYKVSKLIFDFKCMKEECYKQRELKLTFDEIKYDFLSVIEDLKKHDYDEAERLLDVITKILTSEIVGERGDLLESVALPILYRKIKEFGDINIVDQEDDYYISSSKIGFLTIKDLKSSVYLHSYLDPMWESRKMAEDIYDVRYNEYVLRGVGLGYLPYQLYQLSRGSIKIHVFEKDKKMIDYAKQYGVLDWIPKDKISITVDEDILSFIKAADKENTGYFFPHYELKNIPEYSVQAMKEVVSEEITSRTFKNDMRINFYRNISSELKLIDCLDRKRIKKDCIIVGAGPSVDETIDFLKKNQENMTIIAVGTILKKLLKEGINPSFIVIFDPSKLVYEQINGCNCKEIPMLIGAFAYWRIAQEYQGEKYIIPINQFSEIESYAKVNNIDLWESGGTVTFTAIDFALRFEARNIYLVGVDLSYPRGMSHATDTLNRNKQDKRNLFLIEGVNGEGVYTDTTFYSFLECIEYLIEKNKGVNYYNLSKIGARIKGTFDLKIEGGV